MRHPRPGFLIPVGIVIAGSVSVLRDSLAGGDKVHLALACVAAVVLLLACSVAPRRWLWPAIVASAAITVAWWLMVIVVDSG